MAKILILHGPNLNMLGNREQEHYGSLTLLELNDKLSTAAHQQNHDLEIQQSNAEYALIDYIHQAKSNQIEFIIFNPAAFTHTSIALRDAFLAVEIPLIEVHLSNIHNRETFRQQSYFSDIAIGVISGFGPQSYLLALDAINKLI